jgi:hypothetical protein
MSVIYDPEKNATESSKPQAEPSVTRSPSPALRWLAGRWRTWLLIVLVVFVVVAVWYVAT